MKTFILLCTVIAIVALVINAIVRSLSEIVADSKTPPEKTRQEGVQDVAEVVSLDSVAKIKANEGESNLATQDAA